MSANRSIFRIAFWGFAAVVLIVTLSPIQKLEITMPFHIQALDKLVHLVIFLVLTGLLNLSYPKLPIKWILICLAGFGFLIEILQGTLPLGRSFEWADWVADIVGVLMGIVFIRMLQKRWNINSIS